MSKTMTENAYKARWHLLGIVSTIAGVSYYWNQVFLKRYVFGLDGNGGDMLKIYTYMTDQEIAHLRFRKRVTWHSIKRQPDDYKSQMPHVSDEELNDLGINTPKRKYVEYNKRPPHDFYL